MKPEAFPKPLTRVTGGLGGEAILIEGSQKTVLHDCGMACFHQELIANLEKALGDKPLDYVILSHSHYDHMGALPYIIKRWPDVKVCGSKKAAEVFQRPGAVKMIASMGKTAAEHYGKIPEDAYGEGLRIDIVLESGDILDLGEEKILAFETKGHTDCSMSYLLQPYGILLASESTGVMDPEGNIRASILKSFDDSFEAAALLKLLPFKHILVPHFGILPAELNATYFDTYIVAAEKEKKLIEDCLKKGLTEEETLEEHKKIYWTEIRAKGQPYRAYEMNTKIIISLIAKNTEAAR